MRKTLVNLNENLKGFRTFLALLLPLLFAYLENLLSNTPSLSLADLKATTILLAPALAKTLWTEVRPRILRLWSEWVLGEGERK